MKLFLVDKNFYPLLMPYLNVIYIYPSFFGNREYHVFFIKSSTFGILPLKDLGFEVTKEHLTFKKYKFNFAKNMTEQLNKITENLKNYEEIVFIVPNIYPYRASIQIFMKYFNLENVKVLYENNLLSDRLIERIEQKDFIEKERDPEILRKEFILKTLDRLTYNFFLQKTPLKMRVKFSTLILDNYFKRKKSKNILKGITEKGEMFAYKMFNSQHIFDITNKYIFLDILFNDVYADPNVMNNILEKYEDYRSFSKFNFNGSQFLVKDGVLNFEFKDYALPKLEEGYIFTKNYFTFDEITYELMDKIYENALVNEDMEIISYEGIPLNFNILDYLKLLLSIEDENEIVNELNSYKERLLNLFDYTKYKYITRCPECIEGKIYENNYVYFCNNCEFRFLKENKTYGIKINKRLFVLLMKYKTIEIYYNGEIKKISLVKGKNGWYNIKMLK